MLCSIFGQIIIQAAFQVIALAMVRNESFYTLSSGNDDEDYKSYDNTVR